MRVYFYVEGKDGKAKEVAQGVKMTTDQVVARAERFAMQHGARCFVMAEVQAEGFAEGYTEWLKIAESEPD